MTRVRLNPLNAYLFLKIMGEKGDEEQLCAFLNAVLGRTGQDVILLTDALEIHFIDMVKFRRLSEKDIRNDLLHRWLTWFDKDSPPALVEEVLTMDAAIQKAEEKMQYVSSDTETLHAYQMREMALSDWTSGINHAKQEGRLEEKRAIAFKIKTCGVPLGHIAEDTGLSPEKIAKL